MSLGEPEWYERMLRGEDHPFHTYDQRIYCLVCAPGEKEAGTANKNLAAPCLPSHTVPSPAPQSTA